MSLLNDEELANLAAALESPRVERKANIDGKASESTRATLCAFANDLVVAGPGVLFVGLDDEGRPVGLKVTDKLLTRLNNYARDGSIQPPPTVEVRRLEIGGGECAAVIVAPHSEPPVSLLGTIWVRHGPSVHRATREEERLLAERRRAHDLPFEATPCVGATLEDLDLLSFDTLRKRAVSSETLRENDRSLEHQLMALRLLTAEDVPTVAGVLLVGQAPTERLPNAYVQFVRFSGADMTSAVADQKRFAANLVRMPSQAVALMDVWNQAPLEVAGARHDVTPAYPLRALRELLMNALVHRTYERTSTPTSVRWFSDHVEIMSPGGVYGTVTPENFGRPGVTDYRNPRLAEAMKVLGYVEQFGFGLEIARQTLAQNGNPPFEAEVTPTYVRVTVRARS